MKLSSKRFVFKTGKSYFEVDLRFILFEFSGGSKSANLWSLLRDAELKSSLHSLSLLWTLSPLFSANIGELPHEDVISSYSVNSWLECGGKCLENTECVTFSHLDELHSVHHINCKIASTRSEFVIIGDETWTTYEIRSTGLVSILKCCIYLLFVKLDNS